MKKTICFGCCISTFDIHFAVSDFLSFYFAKALTRIIFLEKLRIWQKKVIRNVTMTERSKNGRSHKKSYPK